MATIIVIDANPFGPLVEALMACRETMAGFIQSMRDFFSLMKREAPAIVKPAPRRRWRRSANQALPVLLLDRRGKIYHCRNACGSDGYHEP